MIPDSPKLCECGCSQPAPISPYTDHPNGYVKGQPRRFIRGHYRPTAKVRPVPVPKECECGCGQPAPLAQRTDTKRGYVAGQPVRFCVGHWGHTREKAPPLPPNTTVLCACGCGRPTLVAQESSGRGGDVKGQPRRFLRGHNGHRPITERFWEHVDQSAGPDGCWLWTGTVADSGYGVISLHGHFVRAHRWLYETTVGPIPPDLFLCHHCDVRLCVNPAHLFPGTQKDNIADMWAKGRNAGNYVAGDPALQGERHQRAILTNQDVRTIRELAAAGWTCKQLGARFGTVPTNIGNILHGLSWRHVK